MREDKFRLAMRRAAKRKNDGTLPIMPQMNGANNNYSACLKQLGSSRHDPLCNVVTEKINPDCVWCSSVSDGRTEIFEYLDSVNMTSAYALNP